MQLGSLGINSNARSEKQSKQQQLQLELPYSLLPHEEMSKTCAKSSTQTRKRPHTARTGSTCDAATRRVADWYRASQNLQRPERSCCLGGSSEPDALDTHTHTQQACTDINQLWSLS